MQTADFLVIGAGIAGASAAYQLSKHGQVVVLERESMPGYHTTGRSAAVFFDTYGTPTVRRLTRASRSFLESPPEGFCDRPPLTPCGALFIAREDQLAHVDRHLADVAGSGARVERLSAVEIMGRIPVLRDGYVAGGVYEPDAMNMDVNAIHQGYLRGARSRRANLITDAQVSAMSARGGEWEVRTTAGNYCSGIVVNAAGAWCDQVARLAGVEPVGLVPKRRTVILIEPPRGVDASSWPLAIDIEEQFYFKPDAGKLLCSPADETPVPPSDVQAEELDVALLVDRLQRATTLTVRRIEHRWAGLRSFVADKDLVIGMDPSAPGFFWLAGQGGYGIQTSPAAGRAAAALITDDAVPGDLLELGVTCESLGAARLRSHP